MMVRRVVTFFNDIGNVFVLYVVMIVSASVLYALFEGKSWLDGLWWAVVTAMTVGYGDTYPLSWGGRVVGIVLMHVMVFVIGPLIIGQVASRMIVDRDAFTHEEQEWIVKKLQEIDRQTEGVGKQGNGA